MLLINFGDTGWFFGLCFIYILAGCFVGHTVVDTRIPIDIAARRKKKQAKGLARPMRMSEFLTRASSADDTRANAEAARVLQRVVKDTHLSYAEFVLFLLTALLVVGYFVSASIGGADIQLISGSVGLWVFLVGALGVVALVCLALASLWSYRKNGWQLDQRSVILIAITEAVFAG